LYANLDEGVELASTLPKLWRTLAGKIDPRQYESILESLETFGHTAQAERDATSQGLEKVTRRSHADTVAAILAAQGAKSRYFDVRHFGGRGDGRHEDTGAIAAAIDACHAAGGGTVFLSAGVYAIAPIRLRSNVTLALDSGVWLLANSTGSGGAAGYGEHRALLWAEEAENIRIVSPGSIDGTLPGAAANGAGLNVIALHRCENVEIRSLGIEQGTHAGIVVARSGQTLIDNVSITGMGSGIVPIECRGLLISNSRIQIRSDLGQGRSPRGQPIPWEDSPSNRGTDGQVRIQDCVLLPAPSDARR